MRNLLLYINGKLEDVVRLDFVYSNIWERQALIKNAMDGLKIKWRRTMEGQEWEIQLSIESKLK